MIKQYELSEVKLCGGILSLVVDGMKRTRESKQSPPENKKSL